MHDIAKDQLVKKGQNPFASKAVKLKRRDRAISFGLGAATYFILACTLYIFADIGFKGIPVVFKTEAPFVNFEFFTTSPETLMTFETEGGEPYKMNFSE